MNNPVEFIKTLYLGDRGCKKIIFDCWEKEIKLQITNISRIRGDDWNYYDKEDLVDGYLIIENVDFYSIIPSGIFPNDAIHAIHVNQSNDNPKLFEITIEMSSVNNEGESTDVILKANASSLSLENNLLDGVRIRN
jgi:hypothetical protein